jgi:hypothetical protein
MSDHVTWEICPYCGQLAAVGWARAGDSGTPAENRPVEFDCRTGCRVSPDEFAETSDARTPDVARSSLPRRRS